MRQLILLATLLFAITFHTSAQNWEPAGPDDFAQISKPNAYAPRLFSDTLGGVYMAYIDSLTSTYQRVVIRKETPSGWVLLTEVTDNINYDGFNSLCIDKAGNFYFPKDTAIGGFRSILVRKFSGAAWAALGAAYASSETISLRIKMKLLDDAVPYILYSGTSNSIFPSMIKWTSPSWQPVGSIVTNTSYTTLDFDFDSYGAPYVLYDDALNNLRRIKKFDGTNWTIVSTNGGGTFIKIHNDTIYSTYGDAAIWGGTFFATPRFTLLKYDGTTWSIITTVGYSMSSLLYVPNIPPAPSIKISFDTFGNIYLSGGTICKVTGGTVTNFGAEGDLLLLGQDIFYAASQAYYYEGKIRLQKRINSVWAEPYPLSIGPFVGGYFTSYFTYHSMPYHSFFADKYGTPHLFSYGAINTNCLAAFNNSSWTSTQMPAPPLPATERSPFTVKADSANNLYLLYDLQPAQGFINNGLSLYKSTGNNTWSSVGGTITSSVFLYGSFALNKNNTPYVAFSDKSLFAAGRVRVKKYDGVIWDDVSVNTPLVSDTVADEPLVACDTANNLYLLYKQGLNLFVKKFDGTDWNAVGAPLPTINSTDFEIGITESGQPVVASLGNFGNIQKPIVRRFDGTNWDTLGTPGFSLGGASGLSLLVDKDTVYLAYADNIVKGIVVTKYDGNYFGSLGSQTVSRDSASNPILVKAGSDIYVSYASGGLFVKKLASGVLSPITPCLNLTGATASISGADATISWSAGSATSVGFEYAINTQNVLPATTDTMLTNSYTATNLSPGATYYFFVRNMCGIGASDWDTVSFTMPPLLSLSGFNSALSTIQAYPNPFSDQILVDGLTPGDLLQLIDLQGRVVSRTLAVAKGVTSINAAGLAAGYYVLKISTGKEVVSIPLLKCEEEKP